MFSLVVPTYNRPQFVKRLLSYYALKRFRHRIYIFDSSNELIAKENQALVKQLESILQIRYFYEPGKSVGDCLEKFSDIVETKYCAPISDDDFAIPEGIDECIAYLERNPNEALVHGKAAILELAKDEHRADATFGSVICVVPYPLSSLKETSGAKRLQEFFDRSYYLLLYSVMLSSHWKILYSGLSKLVGVKNNNIFKDEIIASAISAVRSPTRELDCLTTVRQGHPGIYTQPSMYKWITNEHWQPSFVFFRNRVSQQLCEIDQISQEQALAVVDEVFERYLERYFGNPKTRRKKISAERIGILKEMRRDARLSKYFELRQQGLQLDKVLRSQFPHLPQPVRLSETQRLRSPAHPHYYAIREIETYLSSGRLE